MEQEGWQEISQLKEAVRADPTNVDLRLRLDRLLYLSHRYPEAIEQFQAALNLAPENLEVRLELGRVCVLAQQYGKAIEEFQRVLIVKETDVIARMELAYAYIKQEKLEEAPSLGKPVILVRENTERPEGVMAGVVKLVGTDKEQIKWETNILLDNKNEYQQMAKVVNLYGDGRAGERIAHIIMSRWTELVERLSFSKEKIPLFIKEALRKLH